MALDPSIPLRVQTVNPLQAITQSQNIQARDVQRRGAEQAIDIQAQEQERRSLIDGAVQLDHFLKNNDIAGGQRFLEGRIQSIEARGGNPQQSIDALDRLRSGDMEGLRADTDSVLGLAELTGAIQPAGGGQERFSATTQNLSGGLTIHTTNTGRKVVSDAQGNILTGQDAISAIKQSEQQEIEQLQQRAQVDVEEARQREQISSEGKRTSEFIQEISTRNRNAARDQRRIKEALQLSDQAAGGLGAGIKVKLSRLLPGINVEDEAALDTALTQIALDQLQQFKGPTTDFEFNVTRDVSSRITDPRGARRAKLKSLERASWFNQREFEQFVRHQRAGGSADDFRFDFNDQVSTSKGEYTLQDLQDTAVANHMSIDEVIQRLNE